MVTMKDVAAAAGVSTATVSNAFGGTGRLSNEVRARVLAVADELRYAGPNPTGSSLRSGRVGAVGVLFTTPLPYAVEDPYCAAMLAGVAEVAQERQSGMWLMPLVPRSAGLDTEQRRQSMEVVRRAVVDGVLADGIDDGHPALGVLMARGVPLVRSMDSTEGRCVVLDEFAAAREVGEHLAGLGHRRVAMLLDADRSACAGSGALSDPTMLFPYARLRLAGLRAGLGPGAEVQPVAAGENMRESGCSAAGVILDAAAPPTAIAAVSDVLALGALDAARQRGLRVGTAVSVTGFDDVAVADSEGLTTVRQPIREKGRLMARMLLEPGFDQRRIVLPTQLVVRASTGPARPYW
jgi:DNA-binding LacI/PurR family transcriptional regulator